MDSYEQRLDKALNEQHRQWFDYERRTIKPEFAEAIPCPVCGSVKLSTFMEKDYFRFCRCDDCAMVFLNPRLNVRATYDFYNGAWTSIYNEEKFIGVSQSTETDNRINKGNIELIERARDAGARGKGNLLEIGIGSGYFLGAAQSAGFDVYGLDVDRSNVERARARFGDHIRNSDIFEAAYAESSFDVVYMRDVFEHVPNPGPLLQEISRVSKTGAILYIEVPNIEGLIYKAVGTRHVCIFGFAHLNYWSPETIRNALGRAGFEVLQIVHESLDCTIADIIGYYRRPSFTSVFKMKTPATLKLFLTGLYGFFRLPLIRHLDQAVTPRLANLLGRGSVIKVVARKRA